MALSVLGSISRMRGGYGGVSNLIYGVSRTFSRMSPGLMLPPTTDEGGDLVYEFFSLAENRVLSFKTCSVFGPTGNHNNLVGSSQGWLGLRSYDNQICLINPLTGRYIKLPTRFPPLRRACFLHASNLIISCSPDSDECRALLGYEFGTALDFCCPSRKDDTWTRIGRGQYYESSPSAVYSRRQKLFFCARVGSSPDRVDLEAWDLRDLLSPKLVTRVDDLNLHCSPRSDNGYLHTDYFLVINDDTDDLFLVRRFVYKEDERFLVRWHYHDDDDDDDDDDSSRPHKAIITFDVHIYDPESRSFRYIEREASLEGLSFFINDNMNGFALSSTEFPELKPDSIYFIVWLPPGWDAMNFGSYDVGIYNYQDTTISPCNYPYDFLGFPLALEPACWFIPTAN